MMLPQTFRRLSWPLVVALTLAACGTAGTEEISRREEEPTANSIQPPESPRLNLGPPHHMFFDVGFLDMMTVHYEGALVMTAQAIAQSERPELQVLASAMQAERESEIAQLQAWRREWFPTYSTEPHFYHEPMKHHMPMRTEDVAEFQMVSDLGAETGEFDQAFLVAMIEHTAATVDMAATAIANTTREEVSTMATQIYEARQAELRQMQTWYREWYGTNPESA